MEHRPVILILPAAIRSHVLPSLYLADALADDYEVVYAVTNDTLAEIVTANGYQAVRHSGNLVGFGMEPSYVASLKQKPTYWRTLKAYYNNELYHARQQELAALIDTLQPKAIFIDLFVLTDFWVLKPRYPHIELLFFNPMPSTYRVKQYPIVSEGYWVQNKQAVVTPKPKTNFWQRLKQPKAALMHWAMWRQRNQLSQIAPLATDATVTQVIANVPELLLAPLAFELAPEVRKSNQHYLGLCMRPHRQDTELDPAFQQAWEGINAQRQVGKRLIYCSFGTFHEGADASLLRFMTQLLEVLAEIPHLQLVCATNQYLIETLRHRRLLTANTHFFTRVPQMQVLADADVFITHAGFGSIKEAIYYGVPMLACPLDPRYDQNGNALKLDHHGLGLRGSFSHERPANLKKKLLRLLNEAAFRQRIEAFRANAQHEDASAVLAELLGEKPSIGVIT